MTIAVAWLLVAAIALLPFGRSIEIPLAILALLGMYLTVRGQINYRTPPLRLLLLLYLAFVIPMLLALPDAVALKKSITTTVGTLRYFFAAVAILNLAEQPRAAAIGNKVLLWGAILVTVWSADALLQAATGTNILGYGVSRGYINGLFGEDDNLKLPFALVIFYPLTVVWAQRNGNIWLGGALVFTVLLAVLFTGKRVAWMTVVIESTLLAVFYLRAGLLSKRLVVAGIALTLIAGIGAYQSSSWVKMRTDNVATAIIHPDYDTINTALSLRLPIWSAAIDVSRDHWINGVGPRGFRYVYADYAPTDDTFAESMDSDQKAAKVSHPHQLALEVLAECGVLGLIGLALLGWILWQRWCAASLTQRQLALPFAVSSAGMFFPLNSQGAFYSSWSCQLFWLMLALTIFALYAAPSNKAETTP